MEEFILKDGRKVLIRQLKATDVDAVRAYNEQLATETIFTNQYPGRPFHGEKYAKSWEDEHNLFLCAVDENGCMIAISSLMMEHPDHAWCCKNADFGISVLKDYYGQGLGTRLMQLMEDWAKKHHLHTINGEVRTVNRRAINLYLKQGFEICGRFKEIAFIDNVWYDNYIIQKIIKE